MACGFVLERFALAVQMLFPERFDASHTTLSCQLRIAFIGLGAIVLHAATALKMQRPVEILWGYHVNLGIAVNTGVTLPGIVLVLYLLYSATL